MKLLSLFTRVTLLGMMFILVATLSNEAVWENPSSDSPTTLGLANSLLGEWALPLMLLGVLMAMAMIGAAYLVRDERRENLLWEFGGEEE